MTSAIMNVWKYDLAVLRSTKAVFSIFVFLSKILCFIFLLLLSDNAEVTQND